MTGCDNAARGTDRLRRPPHRQNRRRRHYKQRNLT